MVPRIQVWFVLTGLCVLSSARGAKNDWAEGAQDDGTGATRDFYNRAGELAWDNYMGDWWDANDAPQGDAAFAVATAADDDSETYIEWDVTSLVQMWVNQTHQNQGMLLRSVGGGGTYNFHSREFTDAARRPELVVTTGAGSQVLPPEADTYLEGSTYRSMGHEDLLRVSGSNPALLRFDLSGYASGTTVTEARLRVMTFQQYGGGSIDIGVFRCAQGHDEPASDPVPGLAMAYQMDENIGADPDVIFFTNFESDQWEDEWTFSGGTIDTVDQDPDRLLVPFQGKALRVLVAEGNTGALNTGFKFQDETGSEPEEIFFRYYLRFGDDWNQTVQGGKMPGISGTYNTAGWGGRPSDGTNGWSARGSFSHTIPADNPLAGTTPIGNYCYHADMTDDDGNVVQQYGSIWIWQNDYRGFIPNNEWHSVEQYLKLNTPGTGGERGAHDGIIRSWIDGRLAFEKTDIRFRDVDSLKIEQIWMNIYHGGTIPSPYDQHAFIDNVVIATRYIGPANTGPPDTTPPAAPANLTVQ